MIIVTILAVLCVALLLHVLVMCAIDKITGDIDACSQFEFLNPIWIHRNHYELNWFGTIVVMLIYNLLLPLISIVYWVSIGVHKLCTVGRRDR